MKRLLVLSAAILLLSAGGYLSHALAAGETTATQTFTNVVTYTVPTVTETVTQTVTTTAPSSPQPYVSNSFEGNLQSAIETAPFYTQFTYPYNNSFDSAHFVATDGASGQGLGLRILSGDKSPNTFGPQTFVGVHPADAHGHQGEDTWYSFKFRIPTSGYNLNHGCSQWMTEWHEQTSSGNSTAFGLCSYSSVNGVPDPNKIQLYFRPAGGSSTSPRYENWITPLPMLAGTEGEFNASGGLVLGRWYRVTLHVNWNTGSGSFECFLDSAPCPFKRWISSSNGDGATWANPYPYPTLYTVNGNPDFVNYGFYMYAPWPPASSELDYDDYEIGPTAASVGLAGH